MSSRCRSGGELQRRGAGERMPSRILADRVGRSGSFEWAKYVTTSKMEVLSKQWMLGCDHKTFSYCIISCVKRGQSDESEAPIPLVAGAGTKVQTNEEVAMKLENVKAKHPQLLYQIEGVKG